MDSGGLKVNGSPLPKTDTGHARSVDTGTASFSLQPWLCNPPVFWKPWGQASHGDFSPTGLPATWQSPGPASVKEPASQSNSQGEGWIILCVCSRPQVQCSERALPLSAARADGCARAWLLGDRHEAHLEGGRRCGQHRPRREPLARSAEILALKLRLQGACPAPRPLSLSASQPAVKGPETPALLVGRRGRSLWLTLHLPFP